MKINKVDHISVAVKDLDAAREVWEPLLGKDGPDDEFADESEHIRVARYQLGEVAIELLQSTVADGEVAKFIKAQGEGVMLVSFGVDNTRESIGELKDREYPTIGGVRTFRDNDICFIHPKQMSGVLVELKSKKSDAPVSSTVDADADAATNYGDNNDYDDNNNDDETFDTINDKG